MSVDTGHLDPGARGQGQGVLDGSGSLVDRSGEQASVVAALRRDGYALLRGMLDDDELDLARAEVDRILATTPKGRDDFEGHRTRRIYALFAKTRAFDYAAVHPRVLPVLDEVLVDYHLSAPTGIDIGPGEVAQPLHPDDGLYPIPRPHMELVVSVMWPLDDFTADNGATRVVPGSHLWADQVPDASSPSVHIEMPAGSALLYLGSLWHGGGANLTERPRRGVVLHYSLAWLRPVENHVLAVDPSVVARLPARLQELLGYNICPPFIGYVDGRHPRRLLEERG